jgi:opacity protein-like surface antigen
MKRFACIAAVCLVALLGVGASSARAQAAAGADSKMYAEFNGGPTLGHKSSGFFGGEFGFRLTGRLDIFVEGSHMNNVGTSDLDERAAPIAAYLGGTATTGYRVNMGAAGIRYNVAASPSIHPYVLAGVGFANVATEVEFAVNGTVIDPATKGVQLGGDLSGTHNKTILVFGFGIHVPFKSRFFGDLGYRYGHILPNTDAVYGSGSNETDTSIPTQRIILGAGVRF